MIGKSTIDDDKLSHSLRSSSHNKFLKLFHILFIFFSLPRVDGFQTKENLITFVASQKIKECCKDSVLLTGNEED